MRPPCVVDGCERPNAARHLCSAHYKRWLKGKPVDGPIRLCIQGANPADRFMARVEMNTETGCWAWNGKHNSDGYGCFAVHGGEVRTHRWSYEQKYGPIPEDLVLDHFFCDDRGCCNPDHVRPVTLWENALRGDTAPARNAAKTHCPQGHPLVPGNLTSARGRNCLTCHRRNHAADERARRARLRGVAS